ncbi:MAG: recombination protein NinG [Pseudohongiellaceae bacterium]
MPKEPTKKTLKRQTDEVFSKYVLHSRADSNGQLTCITCERRLPIAECDCGHFIGRRIESLRYDERNVAPQCRYCNRFGKYGRGEQYLFGRALERVERGRSEQLMREARTGGQLSRTDLRKLRDKYRRLYAEHRERNDLDD